MAKAERVKDLQKWFRLEKYQECEKFSYIDWYIALSIRMELWETLERLREESAGDIAKHPSLAVYQPQLDELYKEPLSNYPMGADSWWRIGKHHLPRKQPVRTLTFADLSRQCRADTIGAEDRLCPPMLGLRWHLMASPYPRTAAHDEAYAMPLEFREHDYKPERLESAVVVDMSAPDAVILKRFKAWLAEARIETNTAPERSFYQPKITEWASNKLLPYLDITIWMAATNNRIPEIVITDMLFPDTHEGMDKIKTIKKWARQAMSDLSWLQAQAAIEAAERVPAAPEAFEN